MTRDKSAKDETLHHQILSDIEGQIMSGKWRPGQKLPFEVDLALSYSCSRMTVNKVMTQLAKSGLIERRKKFGSFVAYPQAQSAVLEIQDIRDEVQSLNLHYCYKLLSSEKRTASVEDIRLLAVPFGSGIVEVNCLHLAGHQPFCLEERIISTDAVPQAGNIDFATTAPGPWLLSQVPWVAAQHRIQAVSADKRQAKLLALGQSEACLVIERITTGANGPVTHVNLTYPGNRRVLTATFKPGESK